MPCVYISVVRKEAKIEVVDVKSSKDTANVGEYVTITATVRNTGNAKGTKNLKLTVNGAWKAGETVTLSPGETKTVSWNLKFDEPGTYKVCVEMI